MKKIDPTVAVIFEVHLNAENQPEYLDIAGELMTDLSEIEGFISIERFASLTDTSKVLSLSFWRDEAAVARWRNLQNHREAQKKGRAYIFDNYRLRVATVIRDYGMFDREQVPGDSKQSHDN